MRIVHRLLAAAATQIGMNHAASDRTWPHDADLYDEIVEVFGPKPRQHRHLRPALDLEDAYCVGSPDHLESFRIVGRNCGHRKFDASMFFEQPKTAVELREPSQAEEIHLKKAEILEIVLVPLDDGAGRHRRVFDGDDIVHRFVTQKESTGMDREMTRKIGNFIDEVKKMTGNRRFWIEAHRSKRFRSDLFLVREKFCQTVERSLRKSKRLAHVAHGGARTVADHIGRHRGMVPAVFFINMLDHLFAPVVLDIEIDIRRLGALLGNKALEEQIHPHRIDSCDAQAVADYRIGRGAAPLTEDAALAAECDDLPHGEKITGVVQVFDKL